MPDERTLDELVADIQDEVVSWLSDYEIFNEDTATNKIFALLERDFLSNTEIPSAYVRRLWNAYQALPNRFKNNSVNGNMFEAIIITTFLKAGIRPIYKQANLVFVPNVKYDIVVFPKKEDGTVDVSAPVVISLKTSLRERYKQADLEGIALKNVYKRGTSYIITLDNDDAINNGKEKIQQKDILGIDDFIHAETEAFNEFVANLQDRTVGKPPEIKVIEKSHTIE